MLALPLGWFWKIITYYSIHSIHVHFFYLKELLMHTRMIYKPSSGTSLMNPLRITASSFAWAFLFRLVCCCFYWLQSDNMYLAYFLDCLICKGKKVFSGIFQIGWLSNVLSQWNALMESVSSWMPLNEIIHFHVSNSCSGNTCHFI